MLGKKKKKKKCTGEVVGCIRERGPRLPPVYGGQGAEGNQTPAPGACLVLQGSPRAGSANGGHTEGV